MTMNRSFAERSQTLHISPGYPGVCLAQKSGKVSRIKSQFDQCSDEVLEFYPSLGKTEAVETRLGAYSHASKDFITDELSTLNRETLFYRVIG